MYHVIPKFNLFYLNTSKAEIMTKQKKSIEKKNINLMRLETKVCS